MELYGVDDEPTLAQASPPQGMTALPPTMEHSLKMHSTSVQCIALRCPEMHCTVLHCTALQTVPYWREKLVSLPCSLAAIRLFPGQQESLVRSQEEASDGHFPLSIAAREEISSLAAAATVTPVMAAAVVMAGHNHPLKIYTQASDIISTCQIHGLTFQSLGVGLPRPRG